MIAKALLLNSFYDSIQYNVGWTITWILTILMAIGIIYVMARYLGGSEKK